MFRRKEEGLFDSDTDLEEMQDDSVHEEKASAPQASSGFTASTSSAHNAPSAAAATTSSQPAAPQPAAAPRPTPAPTANSFRPAASNAAAPLSSDLTRNRLPEAKPAPSMSANTPSAPASFAPPLPPISSGDKSKSVKRVLTVGNDILLKGEIATCDRLVIEGKVDATLNDVHTVEIAECGSFKGSAHIEDAEISGLFEGDLIVRGRLVIYATGKVRGKISYGEIEIERGGELTGEIKIAGAAAVTGNRPITRNATKEDRVAA